MKAFLGTLVLSLALASIANAQEFSHNGNGDGNGGGWHDHCHDIYDNNCPRDTRTCTARDSYNVKYSFTGSYGQPNHRIVEGALAQCRARSRNPSSCHWTACFFQ